MKYIYFRKGNLCYFMKIQLKKIETGKIEDIKKIEKFGLNKAKNISGYGIAIPLILIGLFEVYSYTIYHKWYLLLIGALFFALGLKQAKTVFTYSIKVDTEAKNIKFKNLNLNFDDVESGTLKEMKLGKKSSSCYRYDNKRQKASYNSIIYE